MRWDFRRDAALSLIEVIASVGAWSEAFIATIDTGFEGGITLPFDAALGIYASPRFTQFRLANSELITVPEWVGCVEIEGRAFECDVVVVGNACLLGRQVLDELEVCFVFGKEVRIRFD